MGPIARRFADLELVTLPELPKEPRGVAALRAAASSLGPWSAPASALPIERRVRALDLPRGQDLPPEGGSHENRQRKPVASATDRDRVAAAFRRKETRPRPICSRDASAGSCSEARAASEKDHVRRGDGARPRGRDRARRVLLLSMDPAHSLGDVFGATIGDRARTVPGGPRNLQAREIDAAAEMARFRQKYVAAVDEAFARIARTAGGDQAAFRELIDLAPPGIDEVIAVADVADALTEPKGRYDVIVTDTAPTGHALRLLQTPGVLREWTQALMAILLKYREIVGAGTLASLLVQLSKRLRGLQDILGDPAQARFVVVTRAAALPAAESASLIASLGSLGIAVQAVIVNAAGEDRVRDAARRARRRRKSRGSGDRWASEGNRLRHHRGTCRSAAAAWYRAALGWRGASPGGRSRDGQGQHGCISLPWRAACESRRSRANSTAGSTSRGAPVFAGSLWLITANVPLDVGAPAPSRRAAEGSEWVPRRRRP